MKHRYLHRLYGRSRLVRRLSMNLRARMEFAALGGHKDEAVLRLISRTRQDRESLLGGHEAFMVYSFARAQGALAGEMAEVGVYQGCSARLISLASGGRPLHLFDTFAGLPEPGDAERPFLRQHQYRSCIDAVRDFMADRPEVSFHQGLFPDTAAPVADRRFSFVHLDVDLKAGTRACLEFFYPRMVQGGIIMTHDYSFLDGVKEAFTEFTADKPERVVELPTSQAILIRNLATAPMMATVCSTAIDEIPPLGTVARAGHGTPITISG